MDCSKRVIQQQNQRSFLESLKDLRALIVSSKFVAKQLGVINRSRYEQQFQNIGLLYSQISSVFFRNRELFLVGGGMTLNLLAKFLLHKHLYRKFFRSGSGMRILSQRNKFHELKCVGNINAHNSYSVRSITFDPTGKFMATVSWDKTAKVWSVSPDDAAMTCVATLAGHSDSITSVAFDPTGFFVATGSADNTAKVWRLSPDGAAATCVATLAGHSDSVVSVAFHPTAPLLATGSCDNTAKLWRISADGSAATCVATLAEHRHCVWSVAFHPTAPLLATGSGDKTAKLWR